MALGKQAKTLSKGQVEAVLGYLAKTRHPIRNRVIFLLSAKVGLRAKEIARLTWWMTNDSQGEIGKAICLQDTASKGKSGRVIPLNDEVRDALIEYRRSVPNAGYASIGRPLFLAFVSRAIPVVAGLAFYGLPPFVKFEPCVHL